MSDAPSRTSQDRREIAKRLALDIPVLEGRSNELGVIRRAGKAWSRSLYDVAQDIRALMEGKDD